VSLFGVGLQALLDGPLAFLSKKGPEECRRHPLPSGGPSGGGEERIEQAEPPVSVVVGCDPFVDAVEEPFEAIGSEGVEVALFGKGVNGFPQVGVGPEKVHAPHDLGQLQSFLLLRVDEVRKHVHGPYEVRGGVTRGLVECVFPFVRRHLGMGLDGIEEGADGPFHFWMIVVDPFAAGPAQPACLPATVVLQQLPKKVGDWVGHRVVLPVRSRVGSVGREGVQQALVERIGERARHESGENEWRMVTKPRDVYTPPE
jgi:hypothetical protein